tara:strand:+ start:416 stop:646 length:231 start_codon:yes stop_codon:yes gene_type:complete
MKCIAAKRVATRFITDELNMAQFLFYLAAQCGAQCALNGKTGQLFRQFPCPLWLAISRLNMPTQIGFNDQTEGERV